jgi:hypothetical protein
MSKFLLEHLAVALPKFQMHEHLLPIVVNFEHKWYA